MKTMKKKPAGNTSRVGAAIRKKKFENYFGRVLLRAVWLIPVICTTYATCTIIEKCSEDKRKTVLVDKKQQNKNKPKVDAGTPKPAAADKRSQGR